MLDLENPSGKGTIHEQTDLEPPYYFTSAACMSLYAEALTFANTNSSRVAATPRMAKSIVILCCQVTDLAILNDMRIAERLRDENPESQVYIAGCLARRFDVPMPDGVLRCDHVVDNFARIAQRDLVHYEKPFWVKDFEEADKATRGTSEEMKAGQLFRNQYPLRIGVGCHRNCAYCTIRYTRGRAYEIHTTHKKTVVEFMEHDDVLLVADSPAPNQIRDWYHLAMAVKKPFSIRNVEPQVATACEQELVELSLHGLLRIFHSPIQSDRAEVLHDMHRNVPQTLRYIKEVVPELRKNRVIVATNIITDYKDFPNPSEEALAGFDYVSWNPYWDGKWDRSVAEERWRHYFGA